MKFNQAESYGLNPEIKASFKEPEKKFPFETMPGEKTDPPLFKVERDNKISHQDSHLHIVKEGETRKKIKTPQEELQELQERYNKEPEGRWKELLSRKIYELRREIMKKEQELPVKTEKRITEEPAITKEIKKEPTRIAVPESSEYLPKEQQILQNLQNELNQIPRWQFWKGQERKILRMRIAAQETKITTIKSKQDVLYQEEQFTLIPGEGPELTQKRRQLFEIKQQQDRLAPGYLRDTKQQTLTEIYNQIQELKQQEKMRTKKAV